MKSPTQDLDIGGRDADDDCLGYPGRRLTMIPPRYKLKEERRKVLKISINKLKKIDDPESWLCRSVLINNTMRKLQREAREEKLHKQSLYSKSYFLDTTDCQLNNNNCKDNLDDCVFQRTQDDPTNNLDKIVESSLTNGVSLNEDVVEKIPSIKRCASRKRSLDEDGQVRDILMDSDREPTVLCSDDESPKTDADDMEDCDVHDVLSQLYLPPTPRLLTTIDSDTDDDDLNVVDIDASYMEESKSDECAVPCKKTKLDSDNGFLCNEKSSLPERTLSATVKDDEEVIELEDEEDIKRRLSQSLSSYRKGDAVLPEESPLKTTGVSNSSSMDTCDSSLYSCGHASLFTDMQTVTFHNLIASLET